MFPEKMGSFASVEQKFGHSRRRKVENVQESPHRSQNHKYVQNLSGN